LAVQRAQLYPERSRATPKLALIGRTVTGGWSMANHSPVLATAVKVLIQTTKLLSLAVQTRTLGACAKESFATLSGNISN
jgi:hypothetical protein